MTPLVFKCKIKDKQRLDMSWLSGIDTTNLSEIRNLPINYGSKIFKLSKLFDVSGGNYNNIVIKNSNQRLDNIGNNLKGKEITIFGDTGYGLAKGMYSGKITLHGNTGKNACSGMRGGSVYVLGSTGDGLCCLPTGLNEGIVDGLIYVQKNVGDNSIVRMRRGNIIIGGNIGKNSCLELISGSVTILEKLALIL